MNIVPNSKVTFREYLERVSQEMASFSDDVFLSNWHSNPVSVNELLNGIEWPDVMLPPEECAKLNIPPNSTYADAVNAVRKKRLQRAALN